MLSSFLEYGLLTTGLDTKELVGRSCPDTGKVKVMRLFSPSHHATNAGIITSIARTTKKVSKGIITADRAPSGGGFIGVIMESEHRCGKWKSGGGVKRIWELLQDLWTTPGSLKANPQLPYNPLYLICHPWTTYLLHHRIFIPIARSLHSHGP